MTEINICCCNLLLHVLSVKCWREEERKEVFGLEANLFISSSCFICPGDEKQVTRLAMSFLLALFSVDGEKEESNWPRNVSLKFVFSCYLCAGEEKEVTGIGMIFLLSNSFLLCFVQCWWKERRIRPRNISLKFVFSSCYLCAGEEKEMTWMAMSFLFSFSF